MDIYKKSIYYLKKQDKKIGKKEWNRIAKEKNLLSSRTLEYFLGTTIRQYLNQKSMQ